MGDLKFLEWMMMMVVVVPVVCDTTLHVLAYRHLTYIPMYIVLCTRRLEY
jgi:hypothetical protein